MEGYWDDGGKEFDFMKSSSVRWKCAENQTSLYGIVVLRED